MSAIVSTHHQTPGLAWVAGVAAGVAVLVLRHRHRSRTVRRAAIEVGADGALLLVADVDVRRQVVVREVRRREVPGTACSNPTAVARSLRADARDVGAVEDVVYGREEDDDEARLLWTSARLLTSSASHHKSPLRAVGFAKSRNSGGWRLLAVARHQPPRSDAHVSPSPQQQQQQQRCLVRRVRLGSRSVLDVLSVSASDLISRDADDAPLAPSDALPPGFFFKEDSGSSSLSSDIVVVADTRALRDALSSAGGVLTKAHLESLLRTARRRHSTIGASSSGGGPLPSTKTHDLLVQLELLLAFVTAARLDAAASLTCVPAFGHCSAVLASDALFYKGRHLWASSSSSWASFFPTW